MNDIYGGILIDTTNEIDNAISAIDLYTESVLNALDIMEENEMIKSIYFLESSDEDGNDSKENKGDKSIVGKIGDAIATIFQKIISLFTKGKTSAKGIAQNNGLKKIVNRVKKYGDVKVKIQDVWSFSKFADNAIDDYTKGFDKKTVEVLNRIKGKDKAINVLIDNLNKLAKAMREPAIRRFSVAEGSTSLKHKIAKGIGAATVGVTGIAVNSIQGSIRHGASIASAGKKGNSAEDVKASLDKGSKIAKTTGAVNLGILVGAIAFFFVECPKQIGYEVISIRDLYNRLIGLKPDTFPSISANRARSVSNFMQREENLRYFRDSSDGSKASVKFSQEMSYLLTAYTNFHQSMIDYYFSIILTVINASEPESSVDKVVKPKKSISVPTDDE